MMDGYFPDRETSKMMISKLRFSGLYQLYSQNQKVTNISPEDPRWDSVWKQWPQIARQENVTLPFAAGVLTKNSLLPYSLSIKYQGEFYLATFKDASRLAAALLRGSNKRTLAGKVRERSLQKAGLSKQITDALPQSPDDPVYNRVFPQVFSNPDPKRLDMN